MIVLGSLLGSGMLLLAGGLVYRAIRQRQNARALALHTPNRIEEGRFVKVGDIEQWIQIRGEDRDNPVLLILHGGPGLAYVPFTPTFRSWEECFTVVQWDQRGAGKTYGRNGKAGSGAMTIERMVQDGIEVTEYILKHLNKNKLILFAHSWGTLLGALMVARRPELFSAYVGTGQIVAMASSEAISYDMAIERARAVGNTKALKALEKIGRPPYQDAKTWMTKQMWVTKIAPQPGTGRNLPGFSSILFSPGYSLKDVYRLFTWYTFSPAKLFQQIMSYDARLLSTTFETPFFLFQGDCDMGTPAGPVEDYFATIQAPHKELLLLKGESHTAVLSMPDVFLKELVTRVRPLAIEFPENDEVKV